MPRVQSAAEQEARAIIAGGAMPAEVLKLVARLKKERKFGLGRKVLALAANDARFSGEVRIGQQRALCTYKDPDLPADERLEEALRILQDSDDLETTKNRETLGLVGAVYKRLWEHSAQERYLQLAAAYYERGYAEGEDEDYGYTGINAAYVLDLLAAEESVPHGPRLPAVDTARARRSRAQEIRRELTGRLPGLVLSPGNAWLERMWWFLVTLGEAHFALCEYETARSWLLRARDLSEDEAPDWERESTARQLASVLLLQRRAGDCDADHGERVLLEFLGNGNALESVVRGKIGVALSGGGFRASLYHIGVLARLAELDLLRSVEYLSCVSGGSIVGAHYYLEVRRLLNTKKDSDITPQDYVEIVKRIEDDFLRGVQRNLRTRLLAEFTTNVKMMFASDFSRTRRLGELYERELYAAVPDGGGRSPRWLNEMLVVPKDERPDFRPVDHNWRRRNKVPILVLNATALNTGHNWQFTATWMGEPPASLATSVDANYRLRRLYYDEAPAGHRNVRLGYAVAASACVPGLFEPLPLSQLYEYPPKVRPVVRLVDGGVHDNQGIQSLLEQGCSVLLVSDASGQMSAEDFPGDGMIAVPLRSNSILQARVREAQYRELAARRDAGLLRGLMFIHLKQDLEVEPIGWIGSTDLAPPQTETHTKYGVHKDVQRALAAIRTDLDSFSDAEAYALMCDGYLMTARALKKKPRLGFPVAQAPNATASWKFLRAKPLMISPEPDPELLRQLRVGNQLFFRVWSLNPVLKAAGYCVAGTLLTVLIALAYLYWKEGLVSLTVGNAIVVALGIAAPLLGVGLIARIVNWRKTLDNFLIGLGLAGVGVVLARLHLHVFDRLFLRQGRI